MKTNPILEEVWRIKDELAREAGHDVHLPDDKKLDKEVGRVQLTAQKLEETLKDLKVKAEKKPELTEEIRTCEAMLAQLKLATAQSEPLKKFTDQLNTLKGTGSPFDLAYKSWPDSGIITAEIFAKGGDMNDPIASVREKEGRIQLITKEGDLMDPTPDQVVGHATRLVATAQVRDDYYALFSDTETAERFMDQVRGLALNVYGNTVQGQTEVHFVPDVDADDASLLPDIEEVAGALGGRVIKAAYQGDDEGGSERRKRRRQRKPEKPWQKEPRPEKQEVQTQED